MEAKYSTCFDCHVNENFHIFPQEQLWSHQQCNAYEICDMCPLEQYWTHLQCENCDLPTKKWLWIHLQGHIYAEFGIHNKVIKNMKAL
jgi:uncharacterized CHY-type Zn-finger protein